MRVLIAFLSVVGSLAGANPLATQVGSNASGNSSQSTLLLFTYVRSQGGFDTELTITNSLTTNLATTGSCLLNFYGVGAPAPQATPALTPGQQFTWVLSLGGNGVVGAAFEGYVIANCGFRLGQGYSRVFQPGKSAFGQLAKALATSRSLTSPTHFLIPYATNQFGFETSIAISNTSRDPIGSAQSSGSCTLNFYGSNGAVSQSTTAAIASGTSQLLTLSGLVSNFTGYVIGSCNFGGAEGVGILSNSDQSQAYVIPGEITGPGRSGNLASIVTGMSNAGGVDTGIAIVNTRLDPFGSSAQTNTCTIRFYGTPTVQSVTTPSIAPGRMYVAALSSLAPGFQGYAVVDCAFGLARVWSYRFAGGSNDGDALPVQLVSKVNGARNNPFGVLGSGFRLLGVSRAAGTDTQVTLTNTNLDGLGTTAEGGTCSIRYLSEAGAGSFFTTNLISAGEQVQFNLSSGNAAAGIPAAPEEFRGSMDLNCTFQNAQVLGAITGSPTVNATVVAPSWSYVVVDGVSYPATKTLSWLTGSTHTISAPETTPSPNDPAGRYLFSSWSDGGAMSHEVSPLVNTTYTANYTQQSRLTTGVNPVGAGTITPSLWVNTGSSVGVEATANAGFVFFNYSGGITGPTNPQNVVMDTSKTVVANFATQLPNLAARITGRAGTQAGRTWTIGVTNFGLGNSNNTVVNGVSLQQTAGVACSPVLLPPQPSSGTPLLIGTIAPNGTGSNSMQLSFAGCAPTARFTVTISLSANGGTYNTSTTLYNQFY